MKKRSRWRNWLIGGRSNGNFIDEARRQARQGLPLSVEALEHRALLAAGVAANYAVVNDWQTGFQAQLQLVNQQPTSIAGWQLEFDLARNITSIWDAKIV
ncbi:MAG TPA: cellulose binding domain-containing protein, partial [Pirellulales bacterium]|nr:cellulose binding domain-containing protein [Pirellulales bacterium]